MKNLYTRWYEDRDFPEIKASNDDIIAVVPDPDQRKRLVEMHNLILLELDQTVEDLDFILCEEYDDDE